MSNVIDKKCRLKKAGETIQLKIHAKAWTPTRQVGGLTFFHKFQNIFSQFQNG